MSTASSPAASPFELPKLPQQLMSPKLLSPMSPNLPEPLLRPMGKYHPSNYQSPDTTRVSTPVPTNLSIPTSLQEKKRRERERGSTPAGHGRKSSEVQRKIQQYQKDMIAQAQLAAKVSLKSSARGMSKGSAEKREPVSPRLLPAGSPGPITPLELEGDADEGYMVAGNRHRGHSLIGGGIERERKNLGQARRESAA